jgi:hypothetical protein
MSDTPRTDAQLTQFDSISKYGKHFKNRRGTVSAEFARGLERELAEVRKDLEMAKVSWRLLWADLELARASIRLLRADAAGRLPRQREGA